MGCDVMAIRNRLKEILEERGTKQSWLAEKAGINKSTIGNIIKNRFNTNVEVAIKISDALEMDIKDIWEVVDD